ncbi:hypothetical protein AAFF_G00214100 [Aldrovandia affinis]|uniref:Uncharacterized protein n=1 Tax=Aldrovandia affinis TaxID=143900 RepID=A0AAD7RGT8_9TELE|nr:hypothetical protein AAFF_G00214100 [Aldrovandia affinis]
MELLTDTGPGQRGIPFSVRAHTGFGFEGRKTQTEAKTEDAFAATRSTRGALLGYRGQRPGEAWQGAASVQRASIPSPATWGYPSDNATARHLHPPRQPQILWGDGP